MDEYCTNGSISRSIIRAKAEIKDENQHKRYAIIYRELHKCYLKRSTKMELGVKQEETYGRSMLTLTGEMSLRNSNSTSSLERGFSDSLRSCSDRKNKKRNVFDKTEI